MKLPRLSLVATAVLPFLLALVVSSFNTPVGVQPAAQAASAHVITFDVAADCRTYVPTLNRGETNMVTGKIFPAGTLPAGNANNDPVLSVDGVAPIGDWHHRSQNVLPLPPEIAPAYSSAPPVLATFYFFFNDGRALVTENWGIIEVDGIPTVSGVITGGFGRLSGAAGQTRSTIIGTNATGCRTPQARLLFDLTRFVGGRSDNQSGSVGSREIAGIERPRLAAAS